MRIVVYAFDDCAGVELNLTDADFNAFGCGKGAALRMVERLVSALNIDTRPERPPAYLSQRVVEARAMEQVGEILFDERSPAYKSGKYMDDADQYSCEALSAALEVLSNAQRARLPCSAHNGPGVCPCGECRDGWGSCECENCNESRGCG